jgi:hypothetical protein
MHTHPPPKNGGRAKISGGDDTQTPFLFARLYSPLRVRADDFIKLLIFI